MRDQPSLRVDHIGVAALADLDLRDHVPDQLEIDLGDAHAGVAPRAGNGQRHIRLGFAAEIDPTTSSATSRRSRGISRLRALAVLRLMTSSYLAGCSTGRSAGFAPFKI